MRLSLFQSLILIILFVIFFIKPNYFTYLMNKLNQLVFSKSQKNKKLK